MKPDSVWLLDKQMTRATKLGCSDNAISWFRPDRKVQYREMIKLDATLIYTGRAAAFLSRTMGSNTKVSKLGPLSPPQAKIPRLIPPDCCGEGDALYRDV